MSPTRKLIRNIAIVARTSTRAQAELRTIESQLEVLPRIAEERGLNVVETIIDDGRSGRRIKGRSLRGLMDRIAAGTAHVDGILVAEISRIGREDPDDLASVHEVADLKFLFRKYDIALLTPDSEYRFTGDGHTDTMRRLGDASAEWQVTRERTMRGKRSIAARGRPVSGNVPWGFRWVRRDRLDAGAWTVVGEVAAIIGQIFRWYAVDRLGAPTIALRLNEARIPTPKAAREAKKAAAGKRSKSPSRWQAGPVLFLLANAAYVGRWKQRVGEQIFACKPLEDLTDDDRTRGVIPMPRIVPDDLFERARAITESRGNRRPPVKLTSTLLAGIATCGHCGRAVVNTSFKLADGTRRPRYVCCSAQNRYRAGGKACPLGTFNAALIDDAVWARVSALLLDSRALAIAASLTDDAGHIANAEREVTNLDAKLRRADDQVNDLLRLHRRGTLNDDQRDRAVDDVNRERALVQRNRDLAAQRLASGKRAEAVSKSLDVTADRLRREARHADRAKQNEILRALCPTKEFGFTITKKAGRIEVAGRVCLEVAEGARVALDVA